MTKQAGWPARRIDGTAVSEREALLFSSIAIKPGDDADMIQFSVWGPPALLSSGAIKQQADQMLATFRPARSLPVTRRPAHDADASQPGPGSLRECGSECDCSDVAGANGSIGHLSRGRDWAGTARYEYPAGRSPTTWSMD